MSGHSKWSKIKHQKGADDVKRGNLFTKLTREIIVATREGGTNSESNFRLRLAIQKARDNNMPLDNIDRAIKKASGEGGGGSLVEVTLEGYGPNGTAILVSALTDNRNRTIQEVRSTFTRHGGSLGENGSVAWIFEAKGVITLKAEGVDPDEMALTAIDAGAEDIKVEDDYVEIYTMPDQLENVRKALEEKGQTIDTSEIVNQAKTLVAIEDKDAPQALKLLDKLEEIDGVQNVYSNADFSDAALEQYQSAS